MTRARWLVAVFVLLAGPAWAQAPSIQSRATFATSGGTTSHTPTMPSGSDGVLVACGCIDVDNDSDDAVATPAGWTQVLHEVPVANTVLAVVYAKDAAGGDSLTVTTDANEKSAWVTFRISGMTSVASLTPEVGTRDTGTDETPDPGSVTPAGGSDLYSFLEVFCLDANVGAVTAVSTNYGNLRQAITSGGGSVRIATGDRQLTVAATSEDPDTWTVNDVGNNQWTTFVVALDPDSGGGGGAPSTRKIMLPLVPTGVNPTVQIQQPTSASTFATTDSNIILGGVASDPQGPGTISSVAWVMSGCTTDSDTATGTSAWQDTTVGLVDGVCTIDVTVTDADGNTGQDQIVVTKSASDTDDPTLTISSPSTPNSTTSTTQVVSGTLTDPTSALDSVTAQQTQGPAGCGIGSNTGTAANWSFTITCNQATANAIFTITGCDTAGRCDSALFDHTFTGGTLNIITGSIVDCQEGSAYSQTLSASGGVTPYTWSEVGSALNTGACAGITLSSGGVVSAASCTATAPATCSFTARVTDNDSSTDDQAYSLDITAAGVDGNAFFDNIIATETVLFSNSFRSEALINAATPVPPNQQTVYDATLDAALVTIEAFDPEVHGTDGNQHASNGVKLDWYLDVDYEAAAAPNGSHIRLTMWDEYYYPEWSTTIQGMQDSGGGRLWRNSKTTHIGGFDDYTNSGNNAPGNDGEYFKFEDTYRPSFNTGDNGFKRRRTQAYQWELGEFGVDWTDNEPIQPNNFESFTVRSGVWVRYWFLVDQSSYPAHTTHPSVSPADTPTCDITIWMADETQAPVQVFGPMPFHCGWDSTVNRGWNRISHRHSPKPNRIEFQNGSWVCIDVVHNCPEARIGYRNHVTISLATRNDVFTHLEQPVP